ncbi:MAG: hypothetical protein J6039_03525 [Alphaproteobacteria bacterium]|nr:hypothetical protein [Alphaproteobacteria bacterium]
MKTNQAGRSMIEMLGVLAIIGVLSVGALAGYSKAMTKYRVNKTIDHVTQIVSGVRALFGGHKTYAALGSSNNTKLIGKAHLFPDELISGSGDTYTVQNNIFGGTVTLVASDKRKNNDNKAFIITFTYIPKDACIYLATQDWGSGTSSGLIAISVKKDEAESLASFHLRDSNDNAHIASPNGGTYSIPMQISQATSACDGDENNVISWKFY